MHVAIYARVSTTRQAENDLSIPDQLRQLKEWAKANGHLVVHEYVEPGASATDDKRPVFQQMINDALQKPQNFEAIIIHSLSRFFRDGIQFGVYERKLLKNKVKIISITQLTSDDANGEFVRRMINAFDEHQSKENSKHTSRAMKENARQGYFNGSRPPFGYAAVSTGTSGSHGRKKKKLAIDDAEAGIVRIAYDLYLNGHQGRSMGCKEIAQHLTSRGLLMRGKPWRMQKLHTLLSDPLYMGDYYFNVTNSQTREKRPVEEWVKTPIPAIIDAGMFERVRRKRELRAPEQTPPRVVSSPTLLTGLLKCGICGSGMTLATGKGGRYRYYKCTNRKNKGNQTCSSRNLPMEQTDNQVLNQLAERVLEPERVKSMMVELRKRLKSSKDVQQARINELNKQIALTAEKQNRLYEAIEAGVVELDETLQRRAQQHKSAREALLLELASVRRVQTLPVDQIKASQLDTFAKTLKARLLAKDSELAKSYLHLLVDEIVVTDKTATMKGRHEALAQLAANQSGKSNQVPTFVSGWCARQESNL